MGSDTSESSYTSESRDTSGCGAFAPQSRFTDPPLCVGA